MILFRLIKKCLNSCVFLVVSQNHGALQHYFKDFLVDENKYQLFDPKLLKNTRLGTLPKEIITLINAFALTPDETNELFIKRTKDCRQKCLNDSYENENFIFTVTQQKENRDISSIIRTFSVLSKKNLTTKKFDYVKYRILEKNNIFFSCSPTDSKVIIIDERIATSQNHTTPFIGMTHLHDITCLNSPELCTKTESNSLDKIQECVAVGISDGNDKKYYDIAKICKEKENIYNVCFFNSPSFDKIKKKIPLSSPSPITGCAFNVQGTKIIVRNEEKKFIIYSAATE